MLATQEQVPPSTRAAVAPWALANPHFTSSKPAWCEQVSSGEATTGLSTLFFYTAYLQEAASEEDIALHHPLEDVGVRFRFGCPLRHSTPSAGPAAGAALQG